MTFPEELHNIHKDISVYIVGKGASLAYLQRRHIGHGIVIAINHAVKVIDDLHIPNRIYSMQRDGWSMFEPVFADTLILQKGYSDQCFIDHPFRFVLDIDPTIMSVMTCIDLAEWMGCNRFVFLCFDSLVTGDWTTYDIYTGKPIVTVGSLNYMKHRDAILERIRKCNYELVTPD